MPNTVAPSSRIVARDRCGTPAPDVLLPRLRRGGERGRDDQARARGGRPAGRRLDRGARRRRRVDRSDPRAGRGRRGRRAADHGLPPGQSRLRRRPARRVRRTLAASSSASAMATFSSTFARCRGSSSGSTMLRRPVDVVIGYRVKRRDPPHRIFIAKTYNLIASVRLRPPRARHRLRHEALPARGLRRPAVDDRLALPVGRAADQAPCARRADRAGRRDPLPARGGDEHRRELPQDPAHVPRHRQAALGALDASRPRPSGPRPVRARTPRARSPSPSGQVDVERVDELAEDGEALLVLGADLLGAVRLDAGLVEHALVGVDRRPGSNRDGDGVRGARVDLGLVTARRSRGRGGRGRCRR